MLTLETAIEYVETALARHREDIYSVTNAAYADYDGVEVVHVSVIGSDGASAGAFTVWVQDGALYGEW
jgi:hypothetical protein